MTKNLTKDEEIMVNAAFADMQTTIFMLYLKLSHAPTIEDLHQSYLERGTDVGTYAWNYLLRAFGEDKIQQEIGAFQTTFEDPNMPTDLIATVQTLLETREKEEGEISAY